MNRSELVEIVAERAGSDRAVARRHVDAVFEAIVDAVASGDRVLVTGFGTFDRFDRAARIARNPRTGERIEIAAGTVPRFRFGQTFKNRVAGVSGAAATAPAEIAAAEVAQAPVVTEVVPEAGTGVAPAKKAKKPKKGKKAATKQATKQAAKKAAKKSAKKGSGKKAAKAR
ncbi:HU family DNA-binding protein [Actinomadura sp. SCN-SB]|uniref:HU family DNA-binding protein n=1 Tax=Actinomadura sp. SCN-SB TaxID=3373092 RepID=UPI0037509755